MKTNTIYEVLKLDDLKIAPYQRAPQIARVKKYAEKFDLDLIGNFKISLRDGSYWIIDGQHRRLLLKRVGIDEVMCEIYMGLTYEQEAALFLRINNDRKSVMAIEKERAKIEANDSIAVELHNVVQANGYRYGKNAGLNGIAAVKALNELAKTYGLANIDLTLKLIRQAWDGKEQSRDAEILSGVSMFVNQTPNLDTDMFIKKLKKVEPCSIISKGKSDISTNSMSRFAFIINQYYYKGCRKDAKQ